MFPPIASRRGARRDCRQVTPLEDTEEGNQGHGDSHARQDPVEARALHTAQVSTSIPATSRISEAGDRLEHDCLRSCRHTTDSLLAPAQCLPGGLSLR